MKRYFCELINLTNEEIKECIALVMNALNQSKRVLLGELLDKLHNEGFYYMKKVLNLHLFIFLPLFFCMQRKLLYIDCSSSGASGDMLIASLVDMGASFEKIERALSSVKDYIGSFEAEIREVEKLTHGSSIKHAIKAKAYYFSFSEKEISYEEAREIIKKAEINGSERELALKFLKTLAEAEARIHGEKLSNVKLHDASDSIADFISFSVAFHDLKLDEAEIVSSHINLGRAFPSTLYILKKERASIFSDSNEELTTPTAAAIITSIAKEYSKFIPEMRIEKIGIGAGKKELEDRANILKLIYGSKIEQSLARERQISVLEASLDDISGEILGDAIEKLMQRGALDVCIIPCIMKKGRLGSIVRVICEKESEEKLAREIFELTGSLGVRVAEIGHRYEFERKIEEKSVNIFGKKFRLRFKNNKPEFEDIKKIAEQLGITPLKVIRNMKIDDNEDL